jgi:hypothetical protein
MRERWGTFSVRDHVAESPFVSDVLLYDRLVIPVPDPDDPVSAARWEQQGWKPEDQQRCIEILGIKTDTTEGLALVVPWDKSKEERFRSRMSTAAALAAQQRDPQAGWYMDPFEMTRAMNAEEFKPALPDDVTKAWAVAAYPSAEAFRRDLAAAQAGEERKAQLAFALRHRFFTPRGPDPRHELLKRAVDLSMKDDFRAKRASFYAWQEDVIENEMTDQKAIRELEQLLAAYDAATEKAFGDVVAKFAFTAMPVTLGLGGALLAGPMAGIVIAGVAGLVEFARYWAFDSKPQIDNGDLNAAAMLHDASGILSVA